MKKPRPVKPVKPAEPVLLKQEKKPIPLERRKVAISQQRLDFGATKLAKRQGIHNFTRLEKLAIGSKFARQMMEQGKPQEEIMNFLRQQVGGDEAGMIARNLWPKFEEGRFSDDKRRGIIEAVRVKNQIISDTISQDKFAKLDPGLRDRVLQMLAGERPEIIMGLRSRPYIHNAVISTQDRIEKERRRIEEERRKAEEEERRIEREKSKAEEERKKKEAEGSKSGTQNP